MFDDSLPTFAKPQAQIGKLDSQLPAVNVPHQGFMDSLGALFGDTSGSMFQAMTGKKGQAGAGNPFGVPEDADEAMQMANQIRMQAQAAEKQGGGNGESVGNNIGDALKFITSLFGG
jgi:hypothetical protein